MKERASGKQELEGRLYKVYRFSMYAFGAVVAAGIMGGTWFGLQMIQKHDQKYVHERTEVKADGRRGPALANPFRNAETVQFHLPYLHGADPNTIRYIQALQAAKKKNIPNGFQLDGEYRSGNIKQKISLDLSCQGALCHLDFKLPARMVLTPSYNGRRFVFPKRTYQVAANGYVFEVLDSELAGVRPEDKADVAAFSENLNLTPYYREGFYDAKGRWIKPEV
jgi:hypothetical protein